MNNKKSGLLSSMAIIQLVGILIIANLILASVHLEFAINNLKIRTVMYHQLFLGKNGVGKYSGIEFVIVESDARKCIVWQNLFYEEEQLCL